MTSQRSLSDSLQTLPKAERLSECVTWDALHSALLRDGEQLQQVGHEDGLAGLIKITGRRFLFQFLIRVVNS